MVILIFITYLLFKSISLGFEISQILPDPNKLISYDPPLTTEFYDRNGQLLYRFYDGINRTLVKLDDLPKHLINATIAIEDQNFYAHNGVDLPAVARTVYYNFTENKLEGASTITQQLVKNSLLSSEKTFERKIKEAIISVWTETQFNKDEILSMYLNRIPYGGELLGVEAASQTYFGKSAKELSLAQSAYIAGLPASPTKYSPYGTHPQLGLDRQKEVLKRMVEDGYITQQEADTAGNEELQFQPLSNTLAAPHFVMYVKDYLANKYGIKRVVQGGFKVYTTLDLGLQEGVEDIVRDEIDKLKGLNVQNGAAMVTDPKTGQILAMVGSKDYYDSKNDGNYNVTTSLRSPGSSIKPVTYAAAFEKGFSPGNTISDSPLVFKDEWGNRYAPTNYDSKFHGLVSLRTALGCSYNVPAVALLNKIGVDSMVELAKEMGITTFKEPGGYGLAVTLGAAEVKMTDMMSVYGTFSQMGTKHQITPILRITDSQGTVIEEFHDGPIQVLDPAVAYLISHVLSDNTARTPAFGPNSQLYIKDQPVAVKTGTSHFKTDNWTMGYTEDFVIGVWVGNNDNSQMHSTLTSGITGASTIWNRITKGMLAKHPSKGFRRPEGVIDVVVNGKKDIAISNKNSKTAAEDNSERIKTSYFDAKVALEN